MHTIILGDYHFSSWSMRARIAALESKLVFNEIVAPLDWPVKIFENSLIPTKSEEIFFEPASGCFCEPTQLSAFLGSSQPCDYPAVLRSRVPCLLVNGAVCAYDSLSIIEYFNDITNLFYPLDPIQRALVRSFCEYVHSDLVSIITELPYSGSFRSLDPRPLTPRCERDLMTFCTAVSEILSKNEDSFLFGEFGAADIMISPFVQQLKGWRVNLSVYGEILANYFERILLRPSIARHLNDALMPYKLLAEAKKDSPQWIARHYRSHKRFGMIHDWQNNVFHFIGQNACAWQIYEHAFSGSCIDDISREIATRFGISISKASKDVTEFLHAIHPCCPNIPNRNPFPSSQ